MPELIDVQQSKHNFNMVNYLFLRNPKSKTAFLAVCYCIGKNVKLNDISDGGLMGPGESYMDRCLSYF